MLNYALSQLVDGPSVPGLFLVLLPVTGLIWRFTGIRWPFAFILSVFVLMSLPVTGKLMLLPLEVGTLFEEADSLPLEGTVDAIAVISSGPSFDKVLKVSVAAPSSYFRMRRGEQLADKLNIPLLISGTYNPAFPEAEKTLLQNFKSNRSNVLVSYEAEGTMDHAQALAAMAKQEGLTDVALMVSGIHALRTRAALKAQGIDVPLVIVGVIDSRFSGFDLIPSFEGFFLFKHALKEYLGIGAYLFQEKISVSDL